MLWIGLISLTVVLTYGHSLEIVSKKNELINYCIEVITKINKNQTCILHLRSLEKDTSELNNDFSNEFLKKVNGECSIIITSSIPYHTSIESLYSIVFVDKIDEVSIFINYVYSI